MKMNKYTMIAAMTLSLALTTSASAMTGNAAAGKEKATTVCAACHGPDGNSPTPAFPKLAGQSEGYLVAMLKHYRSKQRTNAIMTGQAEKLTDQEIADLAAYFSQQTGLQVKR